MNSLSPFYGATLLAPAHLLSPGITMYSSACPVSRESTSSFVRYAAQARGLIAVSYSAYRTMSIPTLSGTTTSAPSYLVHPGVCNVLECTLMQALASCPSSALHETDRS